MSLAGATGVIGNPLLKQLIERGHEVTATTRSATKAGHLRSRGAAPVIVDGLDRSAIGRAVTAAQPEAIIHQMTALTGGADLKHFDRWFAATNALRTKERTIYSQPRAPSARSASLHKAILAGTICGRAGQ